MRKKSSKAGLGKKNERSGRKRQGASNIPLKMASARVLREKLRLKKIGSQ